MKTREIRRWPLALILALTGLSAGLGRPQDEPPTQVAGSPFTVFDHPFSIAEQIFKKGFYAGEYSNWVVLDLAGRFGRFKASLGVLDDWSPTSQGDFTFKVDGKVIKSGVVRHGSTAVPIEIDLRGAKSLRIEMKQCIAADWEFSKAPPEDPGPLPLAPDEDVKWQRKKQTFVWRSPPGASTYSLEIVAMHLDEPVGASATRVWCFTSPEAHLQVDLSAFPFGEYRWTVLAFDDRNMIGKRGLSRRFVLTK